MHAILFTFNLEFFRSRAFMRKGSLGVTFFFSMSVHPYVRKFWESPSVSVQCLSSGPEVDQKLTGIWPEVDRKSVRCPSGGPEVDLMRGIYKRRALAPCDFLSGIRIK